MQVKRNGAARTWRRLALAGGLMLAALAPAATLVFAQSRDSFEDEPINYTESQPTDAVAKLQKDLDRGHLLQRNAKNGYLSAVLRALEIPVSSQVLVYSKTSFQTSYISPNTPRALYFNDDVYVGWVQGGPVVEISAADPQLGAVFYTLNQDRFATQKFKRQTYECLSCHSSTLTGGVPGHTVRSVYPGRDGMPVLSAGTFITRDESPMAERWGGWYVTGTHGRQYHMGNLTVTEEVQPDMLDRSAGANVTNLRRFFDTSAYLSPHSDLVALTVLQHQSQLHNLITRASYETRKALHYEQTLNRELKRGENYRSDSTVSRIKSGCEPLVRGLLFSGEAKLEGPVKGTSTFAADFAARGPWDTRKRSLREFDLKERLFRYPCSYLIYSEAFDALPPEAKEYVFGRLQAVLTAGEPPREYAHLSAADRQAILEILRDTKPEFAASFHRRDAKGAEGRKVGAG
jgi:hypothetical protein